MRGISKEAIFNLSLLTWLKNGDVAHGKCGSSHLFLFFLIFSRKIQISGIRMSHYAALIGLDLCLDHLSLEDVKSMRLSTWISLKVGCVSWCGSILL